MLPKQNRLTSREFSLVMAKGGESNSPLFVAKFLPANSFKFSPAVSKKIWRTAVSRNSTKRRIYGMVREIISKEKPEHFFVVIVAKNSLDDAERDRSLRSLRDLFVKIGVIG